MNRQQSADMNTSNNNDSLVVVLQDVDVVEDNCSNEHFENPCDILSTIEEENSNDISDSDSTSIHSLEFLLDGRLEETINQSDCRRNGPRSQPRKEVNLNHTISNRDRDVGCSYQEVHWGKSAVACGSSHSLRSLSSRATLSTASLSRSSSSLSSSSLSSSRVQNLQSVDETPQPNAVFNLEPKDQHQSWIGENIEISRTEELFDSISSLDAGICSDTAESSSLLEKTTIRSHNDDKIPYEENDDEFADDPQWFQREVLRRQLESRIQMIERTIVKLRLAETTGN